MLNSYSLKISSKVIFAFFIIFLIKISNANSLVSQDSFAPIVEMTTPAVVSISTTQNVKMKNPLEDFLYSFPEGEHSELFKEFIDKSQSLYDTKKPKATSLGSGFIIDSEGFIITNYHIIGNSTDVTVTLANDPDKSYKAKIIGSDAKTDLALLKIDSRDLPYLKIGDSDKSRVGDWIIVIGSPFGLSGTVTAGIISAKARLVPGLHEEFIQTDASINFGNSGGPMINLQGEVIGISSAILTPSLGNVGIGLTIPINVAIPIIKQLKEKGSITRAWLGVKVHAINEDIAKNLSLKDSKGALVEEVIKGSPADKIGMKAGDIILKFNNEIIAHHQKLPAVVGQTEIGKKVNIEYQRDGKILTSEVIVEKLIEEKSDNSIETASDRKDSVSFLGMRVDSLNPMYREKLHLDKKMEGVVITKVNRGSPANYAGILPGDIILRVNKVNVSTISELEKSFNESKTNGAKSVLLLISRSNSNLFLVVPFD